MNQLIKFFKVKTQECDHWKGVWGKDQASVSTESLSSSETQVTMALVYQMRGRAQ